MLLNLSSNSLTTLSEGFFIYQFQLEVLELRWNLFQSIQPQNAKYLKTIYADDFRLCCITTNLNIECLAPRDVFSSCSNLLGHTTFLIWIWFIACSATISNAFVILLAKHSSQDNDSSAHSILITNLAISDLGYSIYLCALATADAVYEGMFGIYNLTWKSSFMCHLFAILSSTSFMMIALILVGITVIRFFCYKQYTYAYIALKVYSNLCHFYYPDYNQFYQYSSID